MAAGEKLPLPPPFGEAMRRHEAEIMRFLLRTTGDREDALDLFQETWLRAYRAYSQLDSEAGLRPWLFRIASNLCRNRWRDAARHSRVIGAGNDDLWDRAKVLPVADAAPLRDGAALDLKRAILALPGRQRHAFVMRRLVGLDYPAIASALGCSTASARTSVYQAMKKLRALI